MGPSAVSLMPLNVKESLLLPPTLFVLILLFLAKQKGGALDCVGVSIECVGPRAEVEVIDLQRCHHTPSEFFAAHCSPATLHETCDLVGVDIPPQFHAPTPGVENETMKCVS